MENKHYKFSKQDGGVVGSNDAKEWINNYKNANPEGPFAFFFGDDIIKTILSQQDAVGMRIYFGLDSANEKKIILVGSREDGTDIWPQDGDDESASTLGDWGLPCPPYC